MAELQRIVVFLAGDRGIRVLEQMERERFEIAALAAPAAKAVALRAASPSVARRSIIDIGDVNGAGTLEQLSAIQSDLFLVAGFGGIFRKSLLELPKYGVVNLHAGPLPQYRGGSPLNWQIINDEKTVGVSVVQMNEGLDAGPILAGHSFAISDADDIASVHETANQAFATLVPPVLRDIAHGRARPIPQQGTPRYWMQRTEAEGRIRWASMTARQVFNLVRALRPPYPGAFTLSNGMKVEIGRAIETDMEIRGTPGRVTYIQGRGPFVACADRAVLISESSQRLANGALLD